jgi:hypothetical protein
MYWIFQVNQAVQFLYINVFIIGSEYVNYDV